jgi:[acyl-carrier-protein] S-malonyltransferase
LTTSVAVFRVLQDKGLRFDVVAGHSLGEWSALVAAGAIQLRDAVKLTHLRGTYMQEAVPVGQGAMAALIGLDLAATRAVCERASQPGESVEPANLNGGGQIVISGHVAAVDRAMADAKAAGAKLAKKLPVSAPFHCSLMKPAADKLAAQLANVAITAPSVPVVANVTAEPTSDAARIKDLLIQQVTAPVRWEESVQTIAKLGVVRAYELGSGAVLKGLVKKIAPTIEVTTIGEPHEVAAFTA